MAAKAVFLDRDNTIIRDPGYISDPSAVQLLPGVTLAIKSLAQAGFKIVVVTNQSGVARGLLTEETLGKIHEEMQRQVNQAGARIDAIYYCPYHPEGTVAQYAIDSDLRKPAPGMLLKAAHDMNIDLAASWMVGDSARDIEAGKRAGCKTIRIVRPAKGQASLDPENATPADYRVRNLVDATRVILRHAGREEAQSTSMKEKAPADAAQSEPVKPVDQPQPVEPPQPVEQPASMLSPIEALGAAQQQSENSDRAEARTKENVATTQSADSPVPQEMSLPEKPAEPQTPEKAESPVQAGGNSFELPSAGVEAKTPEGESLKIALTQPAGETHTKPSAIELPPVAVQTPLSPETAKPQPPVEKAAPVAHAAAPAVRSSAEPAAIAGPVDKSVTSETAKARPDDEFAWASLAGGIAQMVVVGPLVMAFVQIFKQEYSACAAWALLACVFQVMALTCYTIHRNK